MDVLMELRKEIESGMKEEVILFNIIVYRMRT